ncbi:hypothetical protein PVK06_034032 [Gossypium arboreum]|uniref:Uncharacterized protein n=1 Tax=Gossypium arboreum TaxID=29729 RepID=A0ABR0NFY7_GOSAR|nr:hypothetical protein PVK06_034032 [Gossypium arboreum]
MRKLKKLMKGQAIEAKDHDMWVVYSLLLVEEESVEGDYARSKLAKKPMLRVLFPSQSRGRDTPRPMSRHSNKCTPLQLSSGVCRDTLCLCHDIEGSLDFSLSYSLCCDIQSFMLRHSNQYTFGAPSNGLLHTLKEF